MDFLLGFLAGFVTAVLCLLLFVYGLSKRVAASSGVREEKDEADWWKNGDPPPF